MRDKKKSDPKKTAEQEALEKHVDAMMDPKHPDEPVTADVPEPIRQAGKSETESFKTAPQLSSKLRKQIGVSDVPSKPLKIDKLDELTESITGTKASEKSETEEKPEKTETEQPEPDDIPEDDGLDDAQTDKAVDDITAYESDVILAVADSTAEARNRESGTAEEPEKHHIFSTLFWTLVAIIVILVIGLCVLLVMGDSLTSKLGI